MTLEPLSAHNAPTSGPGAAPGPDLLTRIRTAWLLAQASPNTRAAYARDVAMWEGFLDGLGGDPLSATREHVDLWALTRQSTDKGSTLNRRLAAVSSFYRFAADWATDNGLGREIHNPVGSVKRRRTHDGASTRALTAGEYRRLIEAAAAEPPVWGPRDAAAVCLLGLNGFRVSTLTALDVAALGVEGTHHTVDYTVKGGEEKTAPLASMTLGYVNAHLSARRELGEVSQWEPLLLANDGGRLGRDQVERLLARCARRAGLPDPQGVTPHVLRATYATVAHQARVELLDIQDGMDHKSTNTTLGYIRRGERLDRAPTYRLEAHVRAGG